MTNWTRRRQGLKLRSWKRICAIGLWARTRNSSESPIYHNEMTRTAWRALPTILRRFSGVGRQILGIAPKTVQLQGIESFRPKPLPAFYQPGSSRHCGLLWRSRTRSRFALAVVALSLSGCLQKHSPPHITEVTVGTPIRQDVAVSSQWIGTTVGFIDAEIHSKVTGYLMAQEIGRAH